MFLTLIGFATKIVARPEEKREAGIFGHAQMYRRRSDHECAARRQLMCQQKPVDLARPCSAVVALDNLVSAIDERASDLATGGDTDQYAAVRDAYDPIAR